MATKRLKRKARRRDGPPTRRLSRDEYLARPFALAYPPVELGRDPAKLAEVVRRHLAHALVHGPLPKSVRLVHLAVVTPGEPLGLQFPALLRDGPQESKDLLGHYAAAAHFNRQNRTSFHRRFAENPQATYPAMLLVSCDNNKKRKQPVPRSVLFASLRFPEEQTQLDVHESVATYIRPLDGDGCFYADLQALSENPALAPHLAPKRTHTDWDGKFTGPKAQRAIDVGIEQARQAFQTLVHELHQDARYRGAILPCVVEGPILLIDSCPIVSQRNGLPERDDGELGYAGLTLVFEKNYRPTAHDLEACFIVAQQVSLLWGQAGYLAMRHRDEAAHDAYRVVRHSLGNAITWAPSDPADLRRMLRLEEITLSAAPLMSHHGLAPADECITWGEAGPERENLDEALRRGCFRERRTHIDLDTTLLHGKRVDPRLAVLVIELARNLGKHSRHPGAALKVLPGDKPGIVHVEAVSYCDYRFLRDLRDTLRRLSEPERRRGGLDHAWLLAQSLGRGQACCTYLFGDEATATEVEKPVDLDGTTVRLLAPTSTVAELDAARERNDTGVVVQCRIRFEQLRAFEPRT